jgi:hypothetical protein
MSSSSGQPPADRNTTASAGGNVSAEVRLMLLILKCFTFLISRLLTFLSSSISTPFQRTPGLAGSSSEVPADRNASVSDGANVSAKVRHILHML